MQGSQRSLEIKVGAFVIGALALLLGFFFVVGNPTFGPGVGLKLDYAFSGPIKEGASVRLSGVAVGKVQRVEFMPARPQDATPDHPIIRLHVFIEQRAQPLLTEGSRFYVTTLGVLGEHYIDILPGPASAAPLADGATVRGVDLPRTDLLMARMAQLMEQVGGLLDKNELELKDLMAAAAALMKRLDTTLSGTDVGAFLQDVQVTLVDARAVLESARRILKDPDAINALVSEGRTMMTDGRELMGAIKERGPSLLDKADLMMTDAQALAVRMDTLLKALERAGLADDKRLAGLVARSESVMERADRLSVRADALLQQIERGDGTMGKLMKDDQVYEDLKALLRELRVNPWKIMVPGK